MKKELPISLTVHKIGNCLLVDPTKEEEDLSECRVTVTTCGELVSSIQKSNSKEISIDEMNGIFEIAVESSKKLLKEIEKKLK